MPFPEYLFQLNEPSISAEALEDEELLMQFHKIEKLPADKKKIIKELIDAFIFKADLQKQLQA